VATWNLKHLAAEDSQRIDGIAEKLNRSDLDLVALQEVENRNALEELLDNLHSSRYKGFIARYIPYNLRLAYIYDTTTIDSVNARPLTSVDKNPWADRLPFIFTFSVQDQSTTTSFSAINLHAKADIPDRQRAYDKRRSAAEGLYKYVSSEFHDKQVIILGDFNDDLDRSIYKNRQSPYYLFREDTHQYTTITSNLTSNHHSTTLSNDEPIDHILVSDELTDNYRFDPSSRISPIYKTDGSQSADTLSDHYLIITELSKIRKTGVRTPDPHRSREDINKVSNSPNPVRNSTHFTFNLNRPNKISLTIYDLLGRTVDRVNSNRFFGSGPNSIQWSPAAHLPAGVYLYELKTHDGARINHRLTILR
jgi:endonuclease/exonuclease/phosphatase family metal-dependent hydrolase